MTEKTLNLQMFAEGDTQTPAAPATPAPAVGNARSFQSQFKEMLNAVFGARSVFGDFFANGLEVLDGVSDNETAFRVKTTDIPVAVGGAYDTNKDNVFGDGSAGSSRFGDMTEIIYKETSVPYTGGWTIHEGLDRYTVNHNFEQALVDRQEQQAIAKTEWYNKTHGKFVSDSAGQTETLASYTDANILKLFNALTKYFVDNQIVGTKVIKVAPDLYNALVDHALTTTAKHSAASIDENGIVRFKGFTIEQIPTAYFQTGEVAYAYVTGIAKAFTGITTARTIEATTFDGVEIQAAAKTGEYILPVNKKAVVKVKLGTGA